MARPYSVAFKQKMVERLTGKNAISALQLSKETGVRQQNLSRWLQEARNLPLMESNKPTDSKLTVEKKALKGCLTLYQEQEATSISIMASTSVAYYRANQGKKMLNTLKKPIDSLLLT